MVGIFWFFLFINHVNWLGTFRQECISRHLHFFTLHKSWWCWLFLSLSLDTSNSKFEQFVLSFSFQDLLLKEISFLFKVICSTLPLLDALGLSDLFFFHSDLIVSDTLDGFLKVINFIIFHRTIGISFIKLIDKVPEFLLLTFDINIVALEIFILLLG